MINLPLYTNYKT